MRGGPITDEERAFWSFQAITDPEPPRIENPQIKNDIDRFVIERLRKAKLDPMPAADPRGLIRRATFDLTGLPPTPDDIRAFLDDDSPDAFRKVVDRLLESKAYGERWGRHWLDVVRYADTGGFETDMYFRNAWRYRDYVVKSFNDDKPYDRFFQEQIAGDELWPDNLDLENIYTLHGGWLTWMIEQNQ